jgi:hypothetical protein
MDFQLIVFQIFIFWLFLLFSILSRKEKEATSVTADKLYTDRAWGAWAYPVHYRMAFAFHLILLLNTIKLAAVFLRFFLIWDWDIQGFPVPIFLPLDPWEWAICRWLERDRKQKHNCLAQCITLDISRDRESALKQYLKRTKNCYPVFTSRQFIASFVYLSLSCTFIIDYASTFRSVLCKDSWLLFSLAMSSF